MAFQKDAAATFTRVMEEELLIAKQRHQEVNLRNNLP